MFYSKSDILPFEKRVWLSSPTMHGEELKYMSEAYNSNWMSTIGENINQVEINLAEKIGMKYSVALASGTAALHLAVKLAGERLYGKSEVGKGTLFGRRVAVSDLTFAATVNPVVYEGGLPVFIDSERDTWNMDPKALRNALEIYPDIRLLVVAHLYGTPCNIEEIKKVCDEYDVLIVEDAAESLGATYKITKDGDSIWKQTGSVGDFACISFNGNKIITGSSGGMFLTDYEEDARLIRKWSTQSRENVLWYQHEDIGYNYRMSNVVAGVVRGQIPYLEEHIAKKREIYSRYKNSFKNLPVKMNPFDLNKSKPNYWLSCLIIAEDAMCKQVRDDLQAIYKPEYGKTCPTEILEAIFSINAEGRPIWKPMHMQPIYKHSPFISAEENGKKSDVSADVFNRGLCLPSDNKMTVEEQERIIKVVKCCFE